MPLRGRVSEIEGCAALRSVTGSIGGFRTGPYWTPEHRATSLLRAESTAQAGEVFGEIGYGGGQTRPFLPL